MTNFIDSIQVDDVTVKQYPYRTATVRDRFAVASRNEVKPLEEALAKASNSRVDNHTVYEIVPSSGETFYALFSDNKAYLGKSIHVQRW